MPLIWRAGWTILFAVTVIELINSVGQLIEEIQAVFQ